MNSTWKALYTRKQNPEGIFECLSCHKNIFMHPNYSQFGIITCAYCYDKSDLSKSMIKVRGWKFISYKNEIISFICSAGHSSTIKYLSLRKGSRCRQCINESQKKSKLNKNPRPKCSCKGSRPGVIPLVCIHYNHKICPLGGAQDWDYDFNMNTTPEMVTPYSAKKYYYKCPNDKCGKTYQSSPERRARGCRCPYCSGQKVSLSNSLLTTHPELCKELDSNNLIMPEQLIQGSDKKVGWICWNHGSIPVRYVKAVNARTNRGEICPECYKNQEGLSLISNETLTKRVNEIFGIEYVFIDKYSGINTPIKIYCPIKNDSNIDHGMFIKTPRNILRGVGCPKCSANLTESKLIKSVQKSLNELGFQLNINCFAEQKFKGLKYKKHLRVDRVLPSENLCIEADGGFHFEIKDIAGGDEGFKKSQTRDLIKDLYCLRHKINLLRIPYHLDSITEIIKVILNECRSGKHVYATYQHYLDVVSQFIDMKNVYVIIMPIPN